MSFSLPVLCSSNDWFRTVFSIAVFSLACLVHPSLTAAGVVMFEADTRFDFDEFREIHLMQPNGTKPRRVSPAYRMRSATMSPKGDRIAYTRSDKDEVRVINANGKGDRLLFRFSSRIFEIAWSPNGRYLVLGHWKLASDSVSLLNAVSFYDLNTKKIVANYTVSAVPPPAFGGNQITKLDWSPDGALVLIQTKGIFVPGIGLPSVFTRESTFADTRTGRVKEVLDGDVETFGFLNNREALIELAGDGIGVVNVLNGEFSRIVKVGDNDDVANFVRANNGRGILIHLKNFAQSFAGDQTDVTRVAGRSQQAALGYDLLYVDVRTRVARYVSPVVDSFRATNHITGMPMEWRPRTPAGTFRTNTCWGSVITIRGTNRPDRITGTPGSDVIHGLAGNDVIRGGGGDDVICGGRGNDLLLGQAGNDVFHGDELINTNRFNDRVAGRDRIVGGVGFDTLFGNGGNDVLLGGPNDDSIFGQTGNDVLDGQSGDGDRLNGGDGRDRCRNYSAVQECE